MSGRIMLLMMGGRWMGSEFESVDMPFLSIE